VRWTQTEAIIGPFLTATVAHLGQLTVQAYISRDEQGVFYGYEVVDQAGDALSILDEGNFYGQVGYVPGYFEGCVKLSV